MLMYSHALSTNICQTACLCYQFYWIVQASAKVRISAKKYLNFAEKFYTELAMVSYSLQLCCMLSSDDMQLQI